MIKNYTEDKGEYFNLVFPHIFQFLGVTEFPIRINDTDFFKSKDLYKMFYEIKKCEGKKYEL